MKIGYQGVPGSYSEMTLQDYVAQKKTINKKEVEAIGFSNFTDLIDALEAGDLDQIVLPVENSTTGIIARSLDLLRRRKSLVAIAEKYQPVQHTLWGIPGSSIDAIETVYSHPEALSQCDTFFEQYPHIQAVAYEDTAKAAAFISELNDTKKGALASPRAGKLHHLVPLEVSVQTEPSNATRFYIMKKADPQERFEGNRLSLYVETRHEPGALAKLLQAFDIFDCNLEALNARPIPNRPFAYGFFIEVSIENLIAPQAVLEQTVSHLSEYVQLLGQFDPVQR